MPSYHPQRIEPKWQAYWEQNKTFRALDLDRNRPKLYILDMFPYPSRARGCTSAIPKDTPPPISSAATSGCADSTCCTPWAGTPSACPPSNTPSRPARIPRITTQKNIDTFRRQIKSLGLQLRLGPRDRYDRSGLLQVDAMDLPAVFDTWYDPDFDWTDARATQRTGQGPADRRAADPAGYRPTRTPIATRKRLAYRAEVPVNWCPALGTVLANEEVIDGKSERGGHPVVRMPLTQWMLRITAYAERLIDDLEIVDWPRPIKDMQRNWIGRSEGAEVDFRDRRAGSRSPKVPRVDPRLHDPPRHALRRHLHGPGARASAGRPHHDRRRSERRVEAYRKAAARQERSRPHRPGEDQDRRLHRALCRSIPVNGEPIPIWIADYVLMGYGTGAIMAVPGHDERDFEFAKTFDLPIVRVVAPSRRTRPTHPLTEAEVEPGRRGQFARTIEITLDGLPTTEAKAAITAWLDESGLGKKTVNYKLRDWLFSRQRYWGEPFPVVLDEHDRVQAARRSSDLPVRLPELDDFKPTGKPEPPLEQGRRTGSATPRSAPPRDQHDAPVGRLVLVLPALSRPPQRPSVAWDPEKERYWMPVDLYVGGAEHAVLHLLYSRFWHKVLFDRGLVSTPEPFQKLVNQGMILGEMEYTGFQDEPGEWVSSRGRADEHGLRRARTGFDGPATASSCEDQVVKKGEGFRPGRDPDDPGRRPGPQDVQGRGNVINPDAVVAEYGADSLRLYEMFMGPLEAVKPWSMKGVEGVYRFLGRAWRMIVDADADEIRLDAGVQDVELDARAGQAGGAGPSRP